jgi:uncharacterized phage protein gp47/JayE
MSLPTQDFTTLVRNQVAAVQAASNALVDFEEGSILLSMIESNTAGVALWLQGLLLQLLAVTRAATSTASDLDTWVADYGLARLSAVAATGQVTFSRFTPTQQALVLIGTQVETADGTQVFTVILDTTNPNYNAALGGYVILPNTSSINVTVQANTPGSGGNVAIGALNTLTTPIPYVDSVTNTAAFTNGVDAESDVALRVRFIAYIASLSKATKAAIGYAITSVQQGLQYTLTENYDYNGNLTYGYFYVVVDDGTGNPSSQLLGSVNNAIDAVRACCVRFGVFAPVVVTANVVMTITTATGYVHNTVATTVQTALKNFINSLPLGTTLTYTRLAQVAYDAQPGAITNVTSVTLNSGTSDLTATAKQVIKYGTVTVN